MKLNQKYLIILLLVNLIFTVISYVYIISTNYYQLKGVENLLISYFIITSGIYFIDSKLINNKNRDYPPCSKLGLKSRKAFI